MLRVVEAFAKEKERKERLESLGSCIVHQAFRRLQRWKADPYGVTDGDIRGMIHFIRCGESGLSADQLTVLAEELYDSGATDDPKIMELVTVIIEEFG